MPGGCTYWPALRGMEGTYIGFQSMILSILDHLFWNGVLRPFCRSLENSRVLAYVAHIGPKGLFSPNFNSKYLSEFFPYRNDKGMESPLKLTNFLKMLPKRAFHTHNTPKTKNDKTQKSPNLENLGFVICGFGCVVGAKSPFWQHFHKVGQF